MTLSVAQRVSRQFDPRSPSSIITYTGTDPAANVEIAETVPADKFWIVQAFRVVYACDGTAATRTGHLLFDDGATVIAAMVIGTSMIATGTYTMTAAVGAPSNQNGASAQNYSITPLPDIVLPAGYRIQTLTTNRQAGDNYGAPAIMVKEYPLVG